MGLGRVPCQVAAQALSTGQLSLQQGPEWNARYRLVNSPSPPPRYRHASHSPRGAVQVPIYPYWDQCSGSDPHDQTEPVSLRETGIRMLSFDISTDNGYGAVRNLAGWAPPLVRSEADHGDEPPGPFVAIRDTLLGFSGFAPEMACTNHPPYVRIFLRG